MDMGGSIDSRVRELITLIEKPQPTDEDRERAKALAHEIAGVDSLTGLLNRYALSKKFEEEMERVKRHDHPLSAIFVDIDDFKSYNDTYLHSQGDMALKHVASLLRRNIRSGDILARYGGEEFCLLLPETSLQGAIDMAQNMIKRVRDGNVEHYAGSQVNGSMEYRHGMSYQNLTTSVGVANYPQTSRELIFLIKDADESMYTAKKAGKDRIFVFGTTEPLLVNS